MTGEILVNGVERDSRTFRKMSCYIMQQDELCPHLSVMEGILQQRHILKVKILKCLVYCSHDGFG